jgi:hypothetical protein
VKLRNLVVLSAVAVGVAGAGVNAAPANAIPPFPLAPACTKFKFPRPQLVLILSNGQTATFETLVSSDYNVGSNVDQLVEPSGRVWVGSSSGVINGSTINLNVHWKTRDAGFEPMIGDAPSGPPEVDSKFTGNVGPDGIARGSATDNKGYSVTWTSRDQFACADAAAAAEAPPAEQAPPPPAPPKKCPEGSVKPEVPATENCGPPTNTVTMNISGGALSRTVTVNNSGPLGGSCAYNATATGGIFAPPFSQTIDIGPNDQNSINVPAPPIGSTYRVTLTCTGTYDGKQVQFGQAEQEVSA